MFEDFFTIYNQIEPPTSFLDKESLDIPDIKTNTSNFDIYLSINTGTDLFLDSYSIENPFIDERSVDNSFKFVYPEIKEMQTSKNQFNLKTNLKGISLFEKALEEAIKINPEVKNHRNFLIKTAKLESGFNSNILNTAGAPYYGYFLMGKNEIKKTTGLTVEQFRNDPVQQILGAVKLYQMNLKTIKAIGIYDLCKEKGFTDDAMVAGAWLGGPGGVKKFINDSGDPSDSHWYGGKGGTSVGKRMREFNKY